MQVVRGDSAHQLIQLGDPFRPDAVRREIDNWHLARAGIDQVSRRDLRVGGNQCRSDGIRAHPPQQRMCGILVVRSFLRMSRPRGGEYFMLGAQGMRQADDFVGGHRDRDIPGGFGPPSRDFPTATFHDGPVSHQQFDAQPLLQVHGRGLGGPSAAGKLVLFAGRKGRGLSRNTTLRFGGQRGEEVKAIAPLEEFQSADILGANHHRAFPWRNATDDPFPGSARKEVLFREDVPRLLVPSHHPADDIANVQHPVRIGAHSLGIHPEITFVSRGQVVDVFPSHLSVGFQGTHGSRHGDLAGMGIGSRFFGRGEIAGGKEGGDRTRAHHEKQHQHHEADGGQTGPSRGGTS
jgi:hypothetical protein